MESSQMQVTSNHIPSPQNCASGSSKCHRSLTRSYDKDLPVGSYRRNLEKYLDFSRMYQTKNVSEPITRNSRQERKKHIKESNRYICSVPAQLNRSTNRGLSNDQSISACPRSSFSDSGSVNCITPCSGSTGCATGFSTDHSSIYSWRYDEFDKENTQHVRQLFSALDELLYEGKVSSKSETLCKECKDWNMHSPHLRILGNQLESPKQEGIQYVHRRPTSIKMDASPPCLKKRDNHELCVEGHRLTPEPCNDKFVYSRLQLAKLSLCHRPQEEEIYEAEGKIEEFLAYDGRETESEVMDQRWSSTASSWDGVPAVSPNTCIIGTIADELFDDLWSEVVGLLEELLCKHWKKLHSDATFQRLEISSQTLCDPSAHLPLRSNHISPSRGSNRRSMFLWPNNNIQDSNLFSTNLNGVITIQAKPLQQRQQGHSERSFCDSDDGGSTVTCFKTQRGASALSHKSSHQRIVPRLSSRARLCHSFPAQSTLLGTKLSTVAEDLLPQPLSIVQNHRLPFIHLDYTEQDCSASASRHKQLRGRAMRGGAVGAMPAVTSLPPLTESTLLLESLSRPNTTHTFRSETAMKCSFTSMEFAFSMRKGKSFHTGNLSRTGDGIPMGVTGFSVGITSSTANDFPESVTQKRRAHFLCSTDEEGGNIPILGSIGARRTLTRFSGNGRKKLQLAIPQHS